MKKLISLFLVTGTATLVGQITPDNRALTMRGEYAAPCRSWSYESSIRGDVCRFQARRDYYTTVSEVQRVIDDIGKTLNDHEDRIAKLESKIEELLSEKRDNR